AAELSNTAKTLIKESTEQLKEWAKDNNYTWNDNFERAAHAVASVAHQQGMTHLTTVNLTDGQLNFGQKEHFKWNVAHLDGRAASQTPIEQSLEHMRQTDLQQALAQSQAQGRVCSKTKPKSAVKGAVCSGII
ncbi:MAG: hypothetical protein ACRCV6_00850, partial [Formosimonas sp.]